MAQPYSDDLRCKFLEAYEAGNSSLRKLSQQFGVSWGYGKKVVAQQKRTGQKKRPVQLRHGPISRIGPAMRERLRDWLRQQPDSTEVELRDRLETVGVSVCKSRVGQVLREMGLRRKKNRSTPRSATPKSTVAGGKSSSPPSPRSHPKS
jgi:transposase